MKYRIKKDNIPGGYGYWVSDSEDEEKAMRDAIRAEIERNIVPCAKTKEEFRTYITETLGMKQVPMTEHELIEQNAQFIEKLCPEILTTETIPFPTDHLPTPEEVKKIMDNHTQRFREARRIPLEQTGFVFTKYYGEQYIDEYKLGEVYVILEENSYTYSVRGQSHCRNDEDDKLSRHFADNIDIYRGVTEEDIRNKTEWYNLYVTCLTSHAVEEARLNKQ